jgi:hypothetical protein
MNVAAMRPITSVSRDNTNVYVEVDGDILIYIHKPLTLKQAVWLENKVAETGMIDLSFWYPADLYWEAKAEADYEV